MKKAVQQRSIPLEHSECHKVKVGELVPFFQVILNALFWCVLEKASILGSPSKLPMRLNFRRREIKQSTMMPMF